MFILGVGEEVRAYRKKGINRAIAILKPLIRNNPTGWQLYALLGYAYEHKGRFSGGQSDSLKAIEYYKKALKFAKNQKLLIYRLLYSAYESMVVRPMHATGKGNDKKLRQYAKKALNTLNKMLCLKPTLKGFYSKEARELQDWAQYSLK